MTVDESIAASEANYQRLLEWNERYDTKVALVITLATAMLGVLVAAASSLEPHSLEDPFVWGALLIEAFPLTMVIVEVSRGTSPHLMPPPSDLPQQVAGCCWRLLSQCR